MNIEEEVAKVDTSDLDNQYQHATCTNETPWLSLVPGTVFKTLCGKQVMHGLSISWEKCPECEALFLTDPCPLCNQRLADHR